MKIKVPDFHLEATLECGQVFGFTKDAKNVYEGDVRGESVRLWQADGVLNAESMDENGLSSEKITDYFDLERDLTPIYRLLEEDERLKKALEHFRGLRLIRQDSWEALAGFILSSNNNVKRIQGIWRNLVRYFSRRRRSGKIFFPTPQEIAGSHERILRELGLGYRAPFLFYTAKFLSNNSRALEEIRITDYEDAKQRALAFPGIGEKVADCVLLYGFHKHEAFPVDVWILRIMRKLYFRNRRVSESRVRQFAQKKWKHSAGYVQQYLFHGAKTGVL